jgi:hypothetical protein
VLINTGRSIVKYSTTGIAELEMVVAETELDVMRMNPIMNPRVYVFIYLTEVTKLHASTMDIRVSLSNQN